MTTSFEARDALHFIGGEWVSAEGGRTAPNLNPADARQKLGDVALGSRADVGRAVAAARAAGPGWRAISAPERGRMLARAAALALTRRDELARILTLEEGKSFNEARGEIVKGINLLEFYAGEGFRLGGVTRSSEMRDTLLYTVRQPLGVVGLISPWNFPWAIPAWKLAPALVAGNTVVLKPSELTPLVAVELVKILGEAGVPPGVVNLVFGEGAVVGDELVRHPGVKALSFTGSTPVGMGLYAEAARRGIRVTCEMGGKNPAVVLADADLDQAAQGIADGAFGSTGQRCTATSRAIVERSVARALVERLEAKARAYKIGNGLETGINMGPVISERQLTMHLGHIEKARSQGARVVCGGERLTSGELGHGYFLGATVLDGVRPEMAAAREEIFGPVLSVLEVDSLDEALRVSNDVEFGLTASIYSRDANLVMRFVEDVEVGMVHVNSPTVGGEAQIPFGGIKATGIGEREMAEQGLHFFTELKTVFYDFTGAPRRTNIY